MKNDIFKPLSLEIRLKIEENREKGLGHKSISKKLGISRNTVQREIQKNCNGKYDANKAHEKSLKNIEINSEK